VAPFPEREGGAVLSATIASFAYCTLRPRPDNQVTVASLDYGLSIGFGIDEPVVYDGQLDLPKAAISRVLAHSGIKNRGGFDLFLHTNAPPGSGLGSSSAVVVSVVGLVAEYFGLSLSPHEIAELAFALEREDLQIAGGLQDQYAATFGGFNYMEFGRDEVVVNPLRVPDATVHELEHNMLLAYTGRTRASDHIIDDQVNRYVAGNTEALEGLRAQRDLAATMKKALLRGEVDLFGRLLGEAWSQKRRLSPKIATPLIDEAMEVALGCGALGGKVTGAGGGGHMIFCCEFEKRHLVANALIKLGLTVSELVFSRDGVTTWRGRG
jgi:D-glycero-alpha-D-manno-heptose-7-phosphate kinase